MQLSIDTRAAKPIYVQVMDEVRRLVAVGEIAAHDMLPSVRQLAAELRLNHNTIVQAYRELEREGVVYARRGQGTFVAEPSGTEAERDRLLADVVERALTDAHRHGIAPLALIDALSKAAGTQGGKNG
ncbi:MAG TPA: GntR family transcriptional regulator [Allosphingosinicella sp.]